MPATYEPIATTTLGSAAAKITFSSIPATYTDLRIVLVAKDSTGGNSYRVIFNNDSSSALYSSTTLQGNGTTASSTRRPNVSDFIISDNPSTTIPGLYTVDVFNYAGSTYKTCLTSCQEDFNGSGMVNRLVGLWRNTAAITRFDIYQAGTFAAGTTATLYGIKAA